MKKYFKTKEDMQEFINEMVMYNSLIKEQEFEAISTSGGPSGEEEDFPSLSGVKLEKINMPGAAQVATQMLNDLKGKNEKKHAQDIVNAIHKPIFEACKGEGTWETYKDKYTEGMTINDFYVKNISTRHWSSWFLNRCYLGTNVEAEIIQHSKGFGHAGCCYPWYTALDNRKKISENPSSFTGKKMFILVTKDEVMGMGGLSNGDASLVGQGADPPEVSWIASQKELGGGKVHMNIMTGAGWIGGNLSDQVSTSKGDADKANAFMIMVNVGGVKKEESSDIITKGSINSGEEEKSFKPVIGFKKYIITFKGEDSTKRVAYWYKKEDSGKEIVKIKDAKDPKKSVVDLGATKKSEFLNKLKNSSSGASAQFKNI